MLYDVINYLYEFEYNYMISFQIGYNLYDVISYSYEFACLSVKQ